MKRNKIYSILLSAAAIALFLIFGCGKDEVDLTTLLKSHQWYLYYYKIDKDDKTIYATEFQYRIQFNNDKLLKVATQSGNIHMGTWDIESDKLILFIAPHPELTGTWELVEYKVWGYDQDRIVFKNNNIEIGLN